MNAQKIMKMKEDIVRVKNAGSTIRIDKDEIKPSIMNNSHAAFIVNSLKESLAPGNSTWGDRYPEAHALLFRVYGVDIALEIRDKSTVDINNRNDYMSEVIGGMNVDDDIPDRDEMEELRQKDLWS